jgi:hypothetical protein
MPLPSGILRGGYYSSRLAGLKMMLPPGSSGNLKKDIDYFINNQAFENGNYVIVKGCSSVTGKNQRAWVKFVGVFTPAAMK